MVRPISITPYIFDINEHIIDRVNIEQTPYTFNGIYVPRVTEILSAMLHDDGLMGWANHIGFNHQSYKETLEYAATIGTMVHEAIEYKIRGNVDPVFENRNMDINKKASTAYNAFLQWWCIINTNNVEVLMQEQPLICKYYGGTLDLLLKINGKIYIVDFKTSNHPSYKYFLQLAAYREILELEYNIKIDGVMILMLNKNTISFNEIFLNFDNYKDKQYMDDCKTCFLSLVYAYYNRVNIESNFKNILDSR